MIRNSSMRQFLLVLMSTFCVPPPCLAQTTHEAGSADTKQAGPVALPPDARSKGRIVLRGKSIDYIAIAGSLPALDEAGIRRGDIAYVAYLVESGNPSSRPVTFAFNGGPSISSAGVQLGLGPKCLPPHGSSLPPAALIDNADSWVDFTDLVFIDPVGTGWSRALGEAAEGQKHFWGVQQDIDSLSRFVKAWVVKERRWQSPRYLAGASYGGLRSVRMASVLASLNVPLDGVVLLSPAIDFVSQRGGQDPLQPAVVLPSFAAAAIEKATGKDVDPAQLAEIERYALTEYASDLLRGVNDRAAIERMSAKVSQFTGLDSALVRRLGARVDRDTFRRELWRSEGKVGGINDAMMTTYDPDPMSAEVPDANPAAPGPGAISDYISNVLGWKVDAPYEYRLRASSWDWNSEGLYTPGLNGASALRDVLAANPEFRVLVAHGATDLNTLYMGSKLILDQIPDFGNEHRLQLRIYPGGHTFYNSREASRRMLHDDVRAMYESRRRHSAADRAKASERQ